MTGGSKTSKIMPTPSWSDNTYAMSTGGVLVPRTITQMQSDLGLASNYQPLDADLTAIANLTTQAWGRSLLTMSSATAERVALFGREYLVSGTKPTTRGDGTALVSGDLWYDTTLLNLCQWGTNGSLTTWFLTNQTQLSFEQVGTGTPPQILLCGQIRISSTLGFLVQTIGVESVAIAAGNLGFVFSYYPASSFPSTGGTPPSNNIGSALISASLAASTKTQMESNPLLAITDTTARGIACVIYRPTGSSATYSATNAYVFGRYYYQ